ncbi:hypothetical protein I6F35_33810 [Bradyrhizobium sp. BRP22]|uniref:hypothetical protein n=1 Tax=Bradyrhizobium sp. BRP22 TaxID=2793821 RepID=UPI001CD1E9F3|nr:hypothetical protein [Bradyrhizobium sp. BRP22]MCA1458112.1 hypothetical protein [Bradyrhizobium sp. BRP22]
MANFDTRAPVDFKPKPGVPLGKRFTHVYRERGKATTDSNKMRHRFGSLLDGYGQKFEQFAERELGVPTPWSTSASWKTLLAKWDLDDLLDIPTVLTDYLKAKGGEASARIVLREINRIFEEENVSYRVDTNGGVHFLHDHEFEVNARATLAGLGLPRYANSKDRFESGMTAINAAVPDGKTAIRNVFEAAEGLFRLIVPKAHRLAGDQVVALEPLLQRKYDGDKTAQAAAAKLLASFKDWIEACHFYRHEAGKPDEIHQPSLELAVHLVSVGAAFIRLLVELDEGAGG